MNAGLNNFFDYLKRTYRKFLEYSRPFRVPVAEEWGRLMVYLRANRRAKFRVVFVGIPTLLFFILLTVVLADTPTTEDLQSIQNPIASEVYTADSVLLGRYFVQDRTQVKFDEISPLVIKALVATEDVRFYEHGGVDFRSLGRVLIKSVIMQDESSGGGSTITQQLAKNLYPRKKYLMLTMLVNKLKEVIIALRLESIYSKKKILELYLNTIPFADNTYGIQSASQRFFSRDARDISLDQAAVLIGMLKATHYYNPRLFPARSKSRRNVVLAQMVKYEVLSKADSDSLSKTPLTLKYRRTLHDDELAPYFREFLKTELEKWCEQNKKPDGTKYNLYADGLKIYTTIDSRMQRHAEHAIEKGMSEVQQQFIQHLGRDKPWIKNEDILKQAIRRSPRYRKLKEDGLNEEEIIEEMSKKMPMRLFNWKGEEDVKMSPIDSIRHHLQFLSAGFIAVEPSTGKVLTWVGGIQHDFFQYDHVRLATKRQVGSIFKPLVYATAIDEGIEPCELVGAGQETYIDEEGDLWTPRNTQNDYRVKYTMRGGLAYSVNTVTVKLIQRAGVQKTIDLVRKMGIASEIPDVPSIALGASSLSLFEMASAYACIANEGQVSYPFFINAIVDRDGKKYTNFKPAINGQRAMPRETALLVRQMLQTVVHEGTASRIRWKYGVMSDVAGKTGTTQDNTDGWFMAITPTLVIGSWVGADDPRIRFRSTELGQGSNTALPLVAYFLRNIDGDSVLGSYTDASFSRLPNELSARLNCDLYELDDDLMQEIERSIFQRDSIISLDTSASPPPQTFLQTLYKRKVRRSQPAQPAEPLTESEVKDLLNRIQFDQ